MASENDRSWNNNNNEYRTCDNTKTKLLPLLPAGVRLQKREKYLEKCEKLNNFAILLRNLLNPLAECSFYIRRCTPLLANLHKNEALSSRAADAVPVCVNGSEERF